MKDQSDPKNQESGLFGNLLSSKAEGTRPWPDNPSEDKERPSLNHLEAAFRSIASKCVLPCFPLVLHNHASKCFFLRARRPLRI